MSLEYLHGWRFIVLLAVTTATHFSYANTTQTEGWGFTKRGQKVERTTLSNNRGMSVSFIDYGATITSITLADRNGISRNVVLSLPNLAAYEKTQRRFAAIIGRYAGRIGGAQFPLKDQVIELEANSKGVAIHGGPDGYDKRVWLRRDYSGRDSIASVFTLISPDGDQHFPGRLTLQVTYRLFRHRNEFRIDYVAKTNATTVINLTNHVYFNLRGAGSSGLDSHRFQIMADRFAETDEKRVPTGRISSVEGTLLNFQTPSNVKDGLMSKSPLMGSPAGYDHSLIFTHWTKKLALVGVIDDDVSGINMRIMSTEPSVQFNTGNGFDGSELGSEGIAYQRHDGFAFEAQHLPDSPNHPTFPSTLLEPGKVFRSTTSFIFTSHPK